MSEMVKITALPTKLPWVEGVDYEVLPEQPIYGDPVRTRDTSGETFIVYTHPGSYVSPSPVPSWNALAFKRRFTQAERVAILTAAKSSVEVQDFVALLDTAAACQTMIHADDPDVVAGINAYEGAGLIATGRAAQILSGGASP